MEGKKYRKLAAIMFTDIVGYSSIMESDEQRGSRIRKRHRNVFERINKKHDGELLQYFGDGTLSIFPSAAAAVECAVEMQREFQEDPKVPLRIGIHTGDITFTDDDAYGHGMNIAARIEPMCIPGGVYISGKVHEDIINHSWLKAESLGFFELKNIQDAIEVFAISNEGVHIPEYELISRSNRENTHSEKAELENHLSHNRNKIAASLLAFFVGIFGVHRFYLGQRKTGMAYFIAAIIGMISSVWFLIAIPAIIGVIDGLVLATMAKKDFDIKFNLAKTIEKKIPSKPSISKKTRRKMARDSGPASILTPLESAQKAIRTGEYEAAISQLEKILKEEPENNEIHFLMASCYSMMEDAKHGFYHMSKAVEFGYENFRKIKNHFTLAYLRSRKDFKTFEQNGFRLIKMLPSPQENLLATERPLLLKKLEKIEELGELLYRGDISEQEFTDRKRSLLDE